MFALRAWQTKILSAKMCLADKNLISKDVKDKIPIWLQLREIT